MSIMIVSKKSLERLIQQRVDLRLATAQNEFEVERNILLGCRETTEAKLRAEEERCRRIVARLREWESKFHALELAASAHDLMVEERSAVPAKPATLVLKKRKA
jgi:hypothetical protein